MRACLRLIILLVAIGGCDAVSPSSVQRLKIRPSRQDSERLTSGVGRLKIRPLRKDPDNFVRDIRGGHSDDPDSMDSSTTESNVEETQEPKQQLKQRPSRKRKLRHTSDVVRNILEKTEDMDDEEIELRQLIESRAKDYLAELESSEKPPTPLKVLHYLAPKVPAIKHSPDIILRIQTARGDIDSGIAASMISTIARLCIQYDKRTGESIGKQISKDRRFEQLVECVFCGVDVRKRKREAQTLAEGDDTFDMEELLDEEDTKIDEGLSVPDACRAAWGIAMLSGYQPNVFGGQRVTDILMALSLRTRARLLARLQLLRQGELRPFTSSTLALSEGFDKDTQGLAEDVASAIWTFACVKATTGLRTVPLFEASCSLLCQNPTQLRKREQAKKLGLDSNSFEEEEVVEKLAKSENATAQPGADDLEITSNDEGEDKDALLHWLSSNEVAGIMWAVALHGRTDDTGSKQEMDLSDTAAILSEIAFDCIYDWLKEDLSMYREAQATQKELQELQDDPSENSQAVETEIVNHGNGVVVEVVDAATILAKEHAQAMLETVLQNTTVEDSSPVAPKELRVVDAATLLGIQESEELSKVQTELLITSTPMASQETGEQNSVSPAKSSSLSSPSLSELHFSNHKLCSIVWAATDLQDSLRNTLLDIVSEIFTEQGRRSMLDLGGGDLANLAWAIARRTSSSAFSPSDSTATRLLGLLELIAERSLSLVETKKGAAVFEEFQAPELGRMMWSLAMTLSNLSQHTGDGRTLDKDFRQLALLSLRLADTYSSRFGTEDLARITWGFLELSVLEDVLRDPAVSATLGRMISAMEASVLRWESGQCEKISKDSVAQVDESIRFASFLGRPRLSLRILDQRLYTPIDDDDESHPTDSEKSHHLPLLRDLHMDPATMCKLAYGLSCTQRLFPEIDGAWTFTRIAVRLMSSKNGQLLKVSSPGDDLRLAYACAANEFAGYGREFITRLYARRFVQRLNDQLACREKGYVSDRLALSPEDMSTLVWSLGELGARHWKTEQGTNGTAYNKLRLVTDLPFLSESQLESLSPHSTARLLHGAVSMEMLSSVPGTMLSLLRALESKSDAELATVDLCELTECLARIKTTSGETEVITAPPAENPGPISNTTKAPTDKNSTRTTKQVDEDTVIADTGLDFSNAISTSVVHLLQVVARTATEELKSMAAGQMRRLLANYAGLPFQADDFINAIDNEINDRLKATKYVTNLPESASRAATAARGSWDALAEKSDDGSSHLAALRNGLRSMFSKSPGEGEEKDPEGDFSKLEEVADLLTETATTAHIVTDHFARVLKLTNKDPGLLLSAEQRGSVFELSRCQELIASYRRVNFGSGERQSRQDDLERKGIGDQVISRIFY